jgi:hypothetical protein
VLDQEDTRDENSGEWYSISVRVHRPKEQGTHHQHNQINNKSSFFHNQKKGTGYFYTEKK